MTLQPRNADGNFATWQVRNPPGQWRLLWPAIFCWIGATIVVSRPETVRAFVWFTGLICLAIVASIIGARRYPKLRKLLSYLAVTSAALVLIASRIDVIEHSRNSPEFEMLAQTQRIVTLDVALTSFPSPTTSSFNGQGAWATARASGTQGSVPLVLWFSAPALDDWSPGSQLQTRGTLERLDPGSAQAFGFSVKEVVSPSGVVSVNISSANIIAASLRTGLREAAREVYGAELVPGFAVGDTSLVTEELSEQMKASSLTHLVAVSGANCALITTSIMYLASLLGAGRKVRLLLAGVALGGFVIVVGPDPSVQRAAIMAAVMLISGFGGKKAIALPALGLAILLLLVIDPWQSRHPGFVLSVAATCGIILLVPQLEILTKKIVQLPRWIVLPVVTALAAQITCGPVLILLQPGIPAVGVLANVLAAPAAPLGTGIGIISMILLPVSPTIGATVLWGASLPARWVAATAEVSSSLPLARWHWPEDVWGAVLLAGCEAAIIIAVLIHRGVIGATATEVLHRQPWKPLTAKPRSVRLIRNLWLSSGVGIFIAATILVPATERFMTPAGWSVVACDVGQGDALLLRDPQQPKEVMLVDTGDDTELLRKCLSLFGVNRISLLVLSHDDQDHVGAMASILHMVDAALISPPVAGKEDELRPVAFELEQSGIPVTVGVSGMHGGFRRILSDHAETAVPVSGQLEWLILAPTEDEKPSSANAASLVMLVQAGEIRMLLLGDTGREQHLTLLRRPQNLQADVVKVTHHGSKDQDGRVLMHAAAEIALFSVGSKNTYGHPTTEALEAAATAGSHSLRTDLHGSIAVSPQQGGVEIWVEREERAK